MDLATLLPGQVASPFFLAVVWEPISDATESSLLFCLLLRQRWVWKIGPAGPATVLGMISRPCLHFSFCTTANVRWWCTKEYQEMGFVLFSLDILGNGLVNNPFSVSSLFCAWLYPLFASFFVVRSCLLFLFRAVGVVNWEFTLCCCPCGYSMLLSVKGFQELFLCGCIIIKQGCIFELGRIYGLCIFCPMF